MFLTWSFPQALLLSIPLLNQITLKNATHGTKFLSPLHCIDAAKYMYSSSEYLIFPTIAIEIPHDHWVVRGGRRSAKHHSNANRRHTYIYTSEKNEKRRKNGATRCIVTVARRYRRQFDHACATKHIRGGQPGGPFASHPSILVIQRGEWDAV